VPSTFIKVKWKVKNTHVLFPLEQKKCIAKQRNFKEQEEKEKETFVERIILGPSFWR